MHKVLFYRTRSGNSVVQEWIRSFAKRDRAIVGEDLMTVQLGFPMGLPLCRPLGDGLWEVRSTLRAKQEVRLIFFHDAKAQALVVVNGFVKKSQKTPKAEIEIAKARKREFSP